MLMLELMSHNWAELDISLSSSICAHSLDTKKQISAMSVRNIKKLKILYKRVLGKVKKNLPTYTEGTTSENRKIDKTEGYERYFTKGYLV